MDVYCAVCVTCILLCDVLYCTLCLTVTGVPYSCYLCSSTVTVFESTTVTCLKKNVSCAAFFWGGGGGEGTYYAYRITPSVCVCVCRTGIAFRVVDGGVRVVLLIVCALDVVWTFCGAFFSEIMLSRASRRFLYEPALETHTPLRRSSSSSDGGGRIK